VSFNDQERPELFRPEETESKITFKATFGINDKKQLSGEVAATFFNNCDPWFSLLREQVKMKSFFGGFTAAELKELKVITTGPEESYAKYTVEKENPFHKDTNLCFYSLPTVTNGISSWGIKLLPKERISSFEIPSVVEENYEFTFALPEGMKLFTSENKMELENKAGRFLFSVKKSGDKVIVTKYMKLDKRVIDPSAYAEFKALMDRWNADRYRQIIFTE
jgi:hypothetical protein